MYTFAKPRAHQLLILLILSLVFSHCLSWVTSPAIAQVHIWSQAFGDGCGQISQGVAVDASGNVFITGYFECTVDFGGGILTSIGSNEIFLAKFNADGVHQWSKRFGSTSADRGLAIAVDASGNVIMAGRFIGTVDFGGGGLLGAGGQDIFLAKYDTNGAHLWSKRFGSGGTDVARGLAVDDSENIFITGSFNGTVDFGSGAMTSAGQSDIFLAKFRSDGANFWSKKFGAGFGDEGQAVGADSTGNVYLRELQVPFLVLLVQIVVEPLVAPVQEGLDHGLALLCGAPLVDHDVEKRGASPRHAHRVGSVMLEWLPLLCQRGTGRYRR